MHIRDYNPQHDEQPVYALWHRALGDLWPVSREGFHHTTVGSAAYQTGDHFVATLGDGQIIGFVATQARTLPGVAASAQPPGELMVILVDPAHQQQGIGRALLNHALRALKHREVTKVQLGAGGLTYFWPGVPTNLPGAWPFFAACGWPRVESSFDLICDLENANTPTDIYERITWPNIAIATAKGADIPAVLAFEARHFPRWHPFYADLAAQGAHHEIVVAQDTQSHEVAGATMAMDFRAPHHQHDFRWRQLLGENTGGIGALGVAENWRDHGVGLALAAYATERLKAQGVTTSFVGYTWLVDWYGQLGYQVWRQYNMSWRKL